MSENNNSNNTNVKPEEISVKIIDLDNPNTKQLIKNLKGPDKKPKKPNWFLQLTDKVSYDQQLCEYQTMLYLWEIANEIKHRPRLGAWLKLVGGTTIAVIGGISMFKGMNSDNTNNLDNNETLNITSNNDDIIE